METGDRVMFNRNVGGGFLGGVFVRKGTVATVTEKINWKRFKVTQEDGTTTEVSEEDVSVIGPKNRRW
jgi:hypothetical protein